MTLLRFLKESELRRSPGRNYCIIKIMHDLALEYGKNFKRITRGQIGDFVQKYENEGTRSVVIATLKVFYNWLYELPPQEYPDCVKWLKCSAPKLSLPVQGLEDLLTDEDINRMIGACDHPRDKAMISTLGESAARVGELLGLNVGSVSFDEYGAIIIVRQEKIKEGQRAILERRIRIPSPTATAYLQDWLNHHPLKGDKNAPLWCRLKGKVYKRIGYSYFYKFLQRVGCKAGIKKRVTPHFFRHSKATKLAKGLKEQVFKKVMGWTPDSKMARVYVHLSGADTDEEILKLYGKKPKLEEPKPSPLEPKVCPRCSEKNPPGHLFCFHCGWSLTVKPIVSEPESVPPGEEIDKRVDEKLREKGVLTISMLESFATSLPPEMRGVYIESIEKLKESMK